MNPLVLPSIESLVGLCKHVVDVKLEQKQDPSFYSYIFTATGIEPVTKQKLVVHQSVDAIPLYDSFMVAGIVKQMLQRLDTYGEAERAKAFPPVKTINVTNGEMFMNGLKIGDLTGPITMKMAPAAKPVYDVYEPVDPL